MTILHDGLDIFGFTSIPFLQPTPKPFTTPAIEAAFGELRRLIHRGGFALLSGPTGCGKSALLRYLCAELNPNAVRIIKTNFSILKDASLLRYLCLRCGIEPRHSIGLNLANLQRAFAESTTPSLLLILDETHHLDYPTIETIRLLADATRETVPLALIFAGADDFRDTLKLRCYEPLKNRITAVLRLAPLAPEQTAAYLQHCLQAANANQLIFDPAAIRLIHDASKGVMRFINTLAVGALHAAAGQRSPTVALDHAHAAVRKTLLDDWEE